MNYKDENPVAPTPFWMSFFTVALVITDCYSSSLNAWLVNCKESTEGLLFWSWIIVFILVKGEAYQTFSLEGKKTAIIVYNYF